MSTLNPMTLNPAASMYRTASYGTASSGTAAPLGRATPTPRLRITARGRAVLGALLAIPLLVGALVLGVQVTAADAGAVPADVEFTTVTVHPGDSLWSIAERVAPNADPAEVVADLTRLNNLGGATLQPGDRLAVPLEYAG